MATYDARADQEDRLRRVNVHGSGSEKALRREDYSGLTGTDIDGCSVPPSTWKILPVTHELAGDAR